MTSLNKVKFHLQRRFFLPQRQKLKSFIMDLFRKEHKTLQHIDYIFISDEELLLINQQHLNHNFYTDIITFDLSDGDGITGEVYISIDRVRENAQTYEVTLQEE